MFCYNIKARTVRETVRKTADYRIKNRNLFNGISGEIKEKPLKIERFQVVHLAAGEGFEPSHTESESAVLPLHNPAKRKGNYNI